MAAEKRMLQNSMEEEAKQMIEDFIQIEFEKEYSTFPTLGRAYIEFWTSNFVDWRYEVVRGNFSCDYKKDVIFKAQEIASEYNLKTEERCNHGLYVLTFFEVNAG